MSLPSPIRVVVIDDQTIVRQGLVTLLGLSSDVQVVGEAGDGEEGAEVVLRERPDVVLLDLRMPRLDGLGCLRRLAESGFLPPTLILTTFDDDEQLIAALRAGAKGYLLKDVSLDALIGTIRTLAAGGTAISPALTERVVRHLTHPGPPAPEDRPEPLTPREVEVLRLLASGLSNKEIAQAFDLSEGTVKHHVSNVLSKLGVRDRTRAVLKAIEEGLV